MVIDLKPKFIFPGEVAVRVENTFVVTDHGMKKMNHFPDEMKLTELNLVPPVI
jgi:Xaa-Pro aminopeptidase